MKKIIILFVLLIGSINLYSQQLDFPKYYVVEKDTIGVILTISQAQRVDNDLELLEIFKKMDVSYKNGEIAYIKVVNGLNEKVAQLDIKVSELNSLNSDNKSLISNLQGQILGYQEELRLANEQSLKKDDQLSNSRSEVNKLKFHRVLLVISTILVSALFISK